MKLVVNQRDKKLDFPSTSRGTENEIKDKKSIMDLISSKDKSISYKTIQSKKRYFDSFKRIAINGKDCDYVRCDMCLILIKYIGKYGTSAVSNHKCNETKVKQTNETIDKHLVKVIKNDQKIKSVLADSIALCVAKDLRLIHMISCEGFQQMAQQFINIGSKYPNITVNDVMPSESTVRNHLKSIYNELKDKVMKELFNIESIGITCDHWVHDCSKTNYLSITVQYIKDHITICRVLATIPVLNKTAEITKNEVKNVLIDFELNNKNRYYVTDNAIAMKTAFKSEEWFGCSAHNINLIHKHTYNDVKIDRKLKCIEELIENSKDLVKHFKHTELENKLTTTLKQSIDIRWDSTLLMLQSISDNYNDIKTLSINDNKTMEYLVKIEEKLLNCFIKKVL